MKKFAVLLASAALVSACGGDVLGKKAPDEMAVIEGPSLVIPPDYELRPPREGGGETYTEQRSLRRVLMATDEEAAKMESTDGWLVERAGGTKRDPNIRERLEREQQARVEVKKKKKSSWFGGWFNEDEEVSAE